jgi:hypothetical protein
MKGTTIDILRLWQMKDDGTWEGANQIVKLAIHIHSVVANSAECERLFSKFGDIHTKKRNRFNEQTVRDMAVVKMALDKEFKSQKPLRRKRKHNELESQPRRSLPSTTAIESQSATEDLPDKELDDLPSIETRDLINSLTAAAIEDDNDDDPSLSTTEPDPALLQRLNAGTEETTHQGPVTGIEQSRAT